MSKIVDVVTARALRRALEPGPMSGSAPAELVQLARGDHRVLDRALGRIHLGLADRASQVGVRARDTLEQALTLVPAPADAGTDRGHTRTRGGVTTAERRQTERVSL